MVKRKKINKTKGGSLCQDGREKYWHECEVGEKMERMRAMVKSQAQQIQDLRNLVHKLASGFDKHTHLKNGELVFRESFQAHNEIQCKGSLNENRGEDVYF